MDGPSGKVTRHLFDGSCDQAQYFHDTIAELIQEFAICSVTLSAEDKHLTCPECSRAYKTMSTLKQHLKQKHQGKNFMPQSDKGNTENSNKDTLRNYGRVALGVCLLAQDFQEARRHGDGGRIMMLFKFFMFHYKATGKHKYAYQILRLLALQKCLLTPKMAHQLTWNRFVNLKGKQDSNIEMDRAMEHRNKMFKEECHGFHGKITDTSVAWVGQAAQPIDQILHCADKAAKTKRSSCKHKKLQMKDEVLALVRMMHAEAIFNKKPGRTLQAFPDFSENSFSHLNLTDIHSWISNTLKRISKLKVFKRR